MGGKHKVSDRLNNTLPILKSSIGADIIYLGLISARPVSSHHSRKILYFLLFEDSIVYPTNHIALRQCKSIVIIMDSQNINRELDQLYAVWGVS